MNKLYLIDGTYELFRNYYALPSLKTKKGREVGAVVGMLRSLIALVIEDDVTHVAVAFDSVIESFRNEMFAEYKTGEGVDQGLLDQFPAAEEATRSLGLVTWGMTRFEADDALATAAARWEDSVQVEQILICSPDKDLKQCVRGDKVICLDRLRERISNEAEVKERYQILPESIPDWLALVGDQADGIPGISRWGEKSASQVLARYGHLEEIPNDSEEWDIKIRGARTLAKNLLEGWEDVILYRDLATLRTDVPLKEDLSDLLWQGPDRSRFEDFCQEIEHPELVDRFPE